MLFQLKKFKRMFNDKFVSKEEYKNLENKVSHLHGIVNRLICSLALVFDRDELHREYQFNSELAEELEQLVEFIEEDPTGLY